MDVDIEQAKTSNEKMNKLIQNALCESKQLDIENEIKLADFLRNIDVCISAVPYHFNLDITKVAIDTGTSLCDLGGNTEIVFKQLSGIP